MRIKMFLFSILTICMIATLPSSNALPFHHIHCRTDSDCNQPNFYCYESRECVQCTNCSVYNRQASTITKCAKNKDECGNCISGMEAETNFDGTFTCQPIYSQITTTHSDQNPATTTTTTNNEINDNSGLYIIISFTILGFFACLFIVIKCKLCEGFKRMLTLRYQNCPPVDNNDNSILPTNPPPPYSEKGPSAPPEEDPLIQRTIILNDDNQRTIPFHNPDYVHGGTFSDNQYVPPINPEVPPINPEVPVAVDETTQPSEWSPTPENSSDLSNQPITFSNILSATNPPQHQHSEQPTNQNSNSESSSNRNPHQLYIQIDLNTTNINNTQIINQT